MRADLIDLHHRARAKNSAQSPAEYAAAIQRFRRKPTRVSRVGYYLAAVVVIAAILLKVTQ